MLTLADIIEVLAGQRPEWATQVITEAIVDSRQVIPGSLFVALVGERADGHDFVQQAFSQGACFALVERDLDYQVKKIDFRNPGELSLATPEEPPICLLVENSLGSFQKIAHAWRKKLQLRVIGITGSVGKSTTKELVAEVLSQRYRTLKNPGNLNNEIGLPLTMLRLSEGHQCAVLEMGFYVPGEIAFLCDLAMPQVGILTNIGTVHAERAGTQEQIARGKAELVQSLPPDPDGVAILNYDDPLVRAMSTQTQAHVFYYGLDPQADLWADGIESLGLEGIRLRIHYRDETIYMRVPLIGRHSVHTVLRATAAGLVEGLTWQEIVNGLRSGHTQLRLAAVRTESGALILDDTYNASPESMLAALNLLEELGGRKVAVLGDMLELGMYERQGHEMVGARVAQVVDELITVGERAHIIADSARRSGLDPQQVTELDDGESVVSFLSGRLVEQDVVLIKGSHGMRLDRITAALEYRA
jgi:UDP-N-acetylmuramoyl-tripeptide--D-alanyl-D-alanine ligase